MPYTPVSYNQIADAFVRDDVFRRADWLLRDAYGMFALPPPSLPDAGGGNWTITLVLLCIVDGISCHVYPTDASAPDQQQRFKRLINNKLHWGLPNKGWYHKQTAAARLYTEFRNPLVHELPIDTNRFARAVDFTSPWSANGVPCNCRISRRSMQCRCGMINWPTLGVQNYNGGKRLKLSCAALYWAVKKMVNTLAADTAIVTAAAAVHQSKAAPQSP